jgi:hypothetical protein
LGITPLRCPIWPDGGKEIKMNIEEISKKANKILNKIKHEDDGDKHVKKCLEADICPWCSNELKVDPIGLPGYYLGTDYYCPKCKEHIDDFNYYDKDYVNKKIRKARHGKRKSAME